MDSKYPVKNPLTLLIPPQRCKAKSKQTGFQCGLNVSKGFDLCRFHGGRSPNAIKKASERLAHLIPAADMALSELVMQSAHLPSKLGAVKEVYDRVNGPLRQTTQVGVGVAIHFGTDWQDEVPVQATIEPVEGEISEPSDGD